jgi:hypothetical protein
MIEVSSGLVNNKQRSMVTRLNLAPLKNADTEAYAEALGGRSQQFQKTKAA